MDPWSSPDGDIFNQARSRYKDIDFLELRRDLQDSPDDPIFLFELGNLYFARRKWPEASLHYERSLAARPDFLEAEFNMAAVCAALGEWDLTNDMTLKLLARKPQCFELYLALGRACRDQGKLQEASGGFARALDMDMNLYHANFSLAEISFSQNPKDPGPAIVEAARGLAIRPDSFTGHFAIAELYSSKGLHAESEKEYRRAVEIQPNSREANLGLAATLLSLGQEMEAGLHAVKSAKNLKTPSLDRAKLPEDFAVPAALQETALARCRTMKKLFPERWEPCMLMGLLLEKRKKPEEALEWYENAVILGGDNPDLCLRLGRIHQKLGRISKSIEYYIPYLRKNPKNHEVRLIVGKGLLRLGKLEEAIMLLREAQKYDSDNNEVRLTLGNAYEKHGRPRDAERLYEEILAIDLSFKRAETALGRVRKILGWREFFDRGVELFAANRIDDAIRQWSFGLTLKDTAALHACLGKAYFSKGLIIEAIGENKKALAMEPENHEIAKEYKTSLRKAKVKIEEEERKAQMWLEGLDIESPYGRISRDIEKALSALSFVFVEDDMATEPLAFEAAPPPDRMRPREQEKAPAVEEKQASPAEKAATKRPKGRVSKKAKAIMEELAALQETKEDGEREPAAEDGTKPAAGDGTKPQAGHGTRSQAGDGTRSQAGHGTRSQAGDGTKSQAGDGAKPAAEEEKPSEPGELGGEDEAPPPLVRRRHASSRKGMPSAADYDIESAAAPGHLYAERPAEEEEAPEPAGVHAQVGPAEEAAPAREEPPADEAAPSREETQAEEETPQPELITVEGAPIAAFVEGITQGTADASGEADPPAPPVETAELETLQEPEAQEDAQSGAAQGEEEEEEEEEGDYEPPSMDSYVEAMPSVGSVRARLDYLREDREFLRAPPTTPSSLRVSSDHVKLRAFSEWIETSLKEKAEESAKTILDEVPEIRVSDLARKKAQEEKEPKETPLKEKVQQAITATEGPMWWGKTAAIEVPPAPKRKLIVGWTQALFWALTAGWYVALVLFEQYSMPVQWALLTGFSSALVAGLILGTVVELESWFDWKAAMISGIVLGPVMAWWLLDFSSWNQRVGIGTSLFCMFLLGGVMRMLFFPPARSQQ